MFLIFHTFGSLDFQTVMAAAAHLPVETAGIGTLTLIGLFLFIGATGKSAQLPLYVWLPDAMEGPTPVSALIHAATMVTAGVYMVARSSAIYAHAPNALATVAVVGALTAIFAASIGLVQNDIKRVLAYSTVSQLGYMFLGCGVGAFAAGVFHLMTHAFFKALLFLGSGSVIHGMSGEQDMRKMGGLKAKMPRTHLTMLVGCIAIAGIPPLAGFFSKDEILWSAFKIGGYGRWVWAVGFVAAAMTAFYMFRLYHMTFSGSFRGGHEAEHHVHESPSTMIVPLQVLAVGSIAGRARRHPRAHRRPDRRAQLVRALPAPGLRRRPPRPREGLHAAGARPRRRGGPHARERGHRGRRHLRGHAVLPGPPRDPGAAGRELRHRPPRAHEQVLRGRALREGLRARPGPRRRQRALRERPLRHRRRRRRGAAGLRGERHRLADAATSWPASRTSGTSGSWTAR